MYHSRLIFFVLMVLLSCLSSLSIATDDPKGASPTFHGGVRDKKSIEDTYPESSLTNINGHSPNDLANEDLESTAVDKRAPAPGFHGMRGKKLIYSVETGGFPIFPVYAPNEMFAPKRASMGFVGMRGKKEMEFVDDDVEQKRAPNMGFVGMRGKKLVDDENNDYFMDKRASMGFVGMRGKKEYAPFMEEEKRAPTNGFFGMRGKKQPNKSSFFGMRGKKYPYEFRGKFVGVRGKKDSNENALPEYVGASADNYITDLDLNDLMALLAEGNGNDEPSWDKRKGPSGFVGMRG